MKNTLTTIAAALTMLFVLSGCNSSPISDAKASSPQNRFPLEFYLFKDRPVTFAYGNTLGNTPADIQKLVTGFDIDIRNSTYLILQTVKNDKSYSYSSGNMAQMVFTMSNIIYPMYEDPAIINAMATDYNSCIRSIGVTRLNRGEGQQCSEQWGTTWKSQVINGLLRSPSLQNSLYTWVKPELRNVVNDLNSQQRIFMKNALDHMIAYTANYNHQAEKQFYRDCCNSAYGENLFVYTGRIVNLRPADDAVINPYRFLETWVYRRVEERTMTAAQINGWLKRIKTDMGI